MSTKLGYKRETHHNTVTKSFSLPEETVKAIVDFEYETRKNNTSHAANELIQLGLKYLKLREENRKRKAALSN